MTPESPMEMLGRLRAEKERESIEYRDKTKRFTEAGALAIKAVMIAGASCTDLQTAKYLCRDAWKKIIKIYPELDVAQDTTQEKNPTSVEQ